MADQVYADIADKQSELVRKALEGSVFAAPASSDAVTTLTIDSTTTPGTPTLAALPTGYADLGFIDENGAVFSDAVTTSDITSWGEVEPTRRDITADVGTLHMVLQETKKATMAMMLGVDPAGITADATTGEVSIAKPTRPSPFYYRLLALGVDQSDAGEIYVARFWPRCCVTDKGDQSYASGDAGLVWDVTLTAYKDSALGYSERQLFGGPGWKPLLAQMGLS